MSTYLMVYVTIFYDICHLVYLQVVKEGASFKTMEGHVGRRHFIGIPGCRHCGELSAFYNVIVDNL